MEGVNKGGDSLKPSAAGANRQPYMATSPTKSKEAGQEALSDKHTMSENIYTNNVRNVIEMFTDASAGESTMNNRLITVELDSGNVALVGYGEKILAEYDEAEGRVTVYRGHEAGGHTTVTRWLNAVTKEAMARRDVTLSSDAPWFAPPNADSAQFIGAYVNFENQSPVERKAHETVVESLRFLDKFL